MDNFQDLDFFLELKSFLYFNATNQSIKSADRKRQLFRANNFMVFTKREIKNHINVFYNKTTITTFICRFNVSN